MSRRVEKGSVAPGWQREKVGIEQASHTGRTGGGRCVLTVTLLVVLLVLGVVAGVMVLPLYR